MLASSCSQRPAEVRRDQSPTPSSVPAVLAASFAYPVGTGHVTQAKDNDPWYNALEFGETDHLGEDWNKNTGGNTDCGEPVLAAGDGFITYASDSGPGWGNVIILEHALPTGERVETLYGHLQAIIRSEGKVTKGEQIGRVGNANGRYLCHLHFEVRTTNCPMWNQAGPGYSRERGGWVDPSDFIDSHR